MSKDKHLLGITAASPLWQYLYTANQAGSCFQTSGASRTAPNQVSEACENAKLMKLSLRMSPGLPNHHFVTSKASNCCLTTTQNSTCKTYLQQVILNLGSQQLAAVDAAGLVSHLRSSARPSC